MTKLDLLRRHGLFTARVPRYTSYPTAPNFGTGVRDNTFREWVEAIAPGSAISLYIHIPFCRRLCWFCACRTQGTQTDAPLRGYLDTLRAELDLLARHLPADIRLSRLHWGGGTPTILPAPMITELADAIHAILPAAETHEFSVEIDPTVLDDDRLDAVAAAGLTRASLGVQDFAPEVQAAIGRDQSFEATRFAVDGLRARGVKNLNLDILYGLPFQTDESLSRTVAQVLDLGPDRLALYGYAHVPWAAKRQILIPEHALPDGEARLRLFELARDRFEGAGFETIGMDHFARADDGLLAAHRAGTLRRNFQGYTDDDASVLVGLGASAISRFPQGYAQNQVSTGTYAKAIGEDRFATCKGHVLTADDRLNAELIDDLMCRFEIDIDGVAERAGTSPDHVRQRVAELDPDLAELLDPGPRGPVLRHRELVRLVAVGFDAYATGAARHSLAV
ncbi:hypothetical protein OCGS_2540 [Oceaniovalibus guishaninsula JLT2003]|uniref:Coproporphyrinogen-III oxidase n=1 Tax=Oceaniovalibus guishaninsula JLT2003 TaxID=1231392 RepID=K2H6Q7_9RHOB|nr:oxygen-independent coproporphyrinogen III oxidase [Oceaniovalibus guishaninsula]EKE43348.1 hypothetical protein OCGS_2540 [Oceaniovalibus guishaninsula JLT2003]